MKTEHETTGERETASERETTGNKGQFQKGNPGGPGNPYARQCAALRKAMHNTVSAEDIQNITEVMKQLALEGDVAAAKFVFAYTVGKPANAADPDRMDLDEFDILAKNHQVPIDDLEGILKGMSVDGLLKVLRIIMPALIDDKMKKTVGALLGKNTKDAGSDTEDMEDEFDDDDDENEKEGEIETSIDDPADVPAWMEDLVSADEHAQKAEAVPDSLQERLNGKPERGPARTGAPLANGPIAKGSPLTNGFHGKHDA